MAKVTSIFGRHLLASYYNYPYGNGNGIGSEWMPFYAGVALTLVLLPFLYCIGLGDYQLFVLLMTKTTLGAAIGLAWFNLPAEDLPSPVPKDRSQNPTGANAVNFKKAA